MKTLNRFAAGLAGGDSAALEASPSARSAYRILGYLMLVAAVMTAVATSFATSRVFGLGVVPSIALGVFWGFGIMLAADVALMTLGMNSSGILSAFVAAVRILLAALVGYLTAAPLILVMFSGSINTQLMQNTADMAMHNAAVVTHSPEQEEVNRVLAEINEQHLIQSGTLPAGATGETSTIKLLSADVRQARQEARQSWMLYRCERYTGETTGLTNPSQCSPYPGPDGSSAPYFNLAKAAANRLTAAEKRLAATEKERHADQRALLAQLQAQAPSKLKSLNAEMATAQRQLSRLKDTLAAQATRSNADPLTQLRALSRAESADPTLEAASWILTFLWTMIAAAPVLAKLLWQRTPAGKAYRRRCEAREAGV